jgi:hypothetical protein
MATYKLQKHPSYDTPISVFYVEGNISIPFDPANMDFVEYNKWLSEGNIPLPPDEPTLP